MPESRSALSIEVVQRVAEVRNEDPLELPPLYETIDPDHLDSFVVVEDEATYTFQYAGCCVTIHGDASISVRRTDIAVEKLAC